MGIVAREESSNCIQDFAFGLLPIAFMPDARHHYLLIQHHQGHWGFPKGHKEGEESNLVAAQREFEEETGVQEYTVFPQVCFTEQYCFWKREQLVRKTVTYFLGLIASDASGQLASVQIQAKEIAAYRWCSAQEVRELLQFEAGLQILAQCEALLANVNQISGNQMSARALASIASDLCNS